MAYASSSDLTARYDSRIIRDLASDTGTPVSEGALATDTRVSAALDDASGRIDSALTVARIYSTDDLDALTGNSLALLKRITCELAMAFLISRRQEKMLDGSTAEVEQKGEDYLDRLRKGERLFGEAEAAKDAGLPSVDGPTSVEYAELNLLPDRTKHFFPSRASRLPTTRG
jgi:phage gp36-like protein